MRLTRRDEEIFRFILAQKFASLEAIYLRFFDRRKHPSEPFPKELFVTRQRLGQLQKAGLLATERVYTESKSLYLLTSKSYQYLKQYGSEPPYAIPPKTVDFRSYVHDIKVTYCRIALERARSAFRWIPERQVRMKGVAINGETLPDSVIPDGIFLNSKGQRYVFELESSDRKIGRFESKASEYRSWISRGLIDHVLWVACDPHILKALRQVTLGDSDFMIGTYEEFSKQLFPGGK